MIDLMVQALNCKEIDTSTKLLLVIAIARRCGGDGGRCWAKQATLARDTRLHPKTVARTLQELEDSVPPLIKRVKHPPREDGTRQSDDIYLTLPAVTLQASIGHTTPSQGVLCPKPSRRGLPKETTKETTKESVASEGKSESDLIRQTAEMIWARAGEMGRRRSTKSKVLSALDSAMSRRPRDVTAQDYAAKIMRGVEAYLKSAEATKDQGAFEKGTHRLLQGDFWSNWLDEKTEAAARTGQDITGAMGTMEAPSEERQRTWMELYERGMAWPADRGPRPGLMGCRVSDQIQREYGHDPYVPAKDVGEAL